jgi:hypothetical protein
VIIIQMVMNKRDTNEMNRENGHNFMLSGDPSSLITCHSRFSIGRDINTV